MHHVVGQTENQAEALSQPSSGTSPAGLHCDGEGSSIRSKRIFLIALYRGLCLFNFMKTFFGNRFIEM